MMPFKMYVCGELQFPREKRHMNVMLKNLSDKYKDSPNDCTVFIAGTILLQLDDGTRVQQEVDVIVLKDNRIIILELKNISGDIIADCSYYSPWLADGMAFIMKEKTVNPYVQVRRERSVLNQYLSGYILQSLIEKERMRSREEEERVRVVIGRKISAWVVTNAPSRISVVNLPPEGYSWFNAIPVNQVADALMIEGESDGLLTQNQLEYFATSLRARPCTLSDWLMRAPQREETRKKGYSRLGVVDSLFELGRDEEAMSALRYVRELRLYAYLNEVGTCFHFQSPQIRKLALIILIEWSVEGLGSLLSEALVDDDAAVRSLSLSWLKDVSYPEAFDALCEIVKRGYSSDFEAALRAIEISRAGKECDFVFNLAQEKIWGSPFANYTRLRALETKQREYRWAVYDKKDESAQKLVEEYERLEADFGSYLKLFGLLCGTLGRLRCSRAVPALIETMRTPEKLGLAGVPWNKPTWEQEDSSFDYYGIFSIVVSALGEIGNHDATKPLIECLHDAPEDWQAATIDALGVLRDGEAVNDIKVFLSSEIHGRRETAFRALSVIGTDEAYRAMMDYYLGALSDPNEERRHEVYSMEHQLELNNRSKFEESIINLLRDKGFPGHEKGFLNALGSIATTKSIDSLFSFSSDPDNYEQAGSILSRVLTPEASDRARALLASQNPIEVAFAIYALWTRSSEGYVKLQDFESSPSADVRRAVAYMYYRRKDRMRLRRFANDEDNEVKYAVFSTFRDAGKATLERNLTATSEQCRRGYLVRTEEALVITQGNQITIASPEDIRVVLVTKHVDEIGLYLVVQQGVLYRSFLVAPSREDSRDDDVNAKRTEDFYYAVLDLTRRTFWQEPEVEEQRAISRMWDRIMEKRKSRAASEAARNRDETSDDEQREEGFL